MDNSFTLRDSCNGETFIAGDFCGSVNGGLPQILRAVYVFRSGIPVNTGWIGRGGQFFNTGTSNVDVLANCDCPDCPVASLALTMSAVFSGNTMNPQVGDTITYTYEVANDGNFDVDDIVINDPDVVITGGPIATLGPGGVDSTTYTATRTVTQADIDARQIINSATVAGTAANGTPIMATSTDATSGAGPTIVTFDVPTLNPAVELDSVGELTLLGGTGLGVTRYDNIPTGFIDSATVGGTVVGGFPQTVSGPDAWAIILNAAEGGSDWFAFEDALYNTAGTTLIAAAGGNPVTILPATVTDPRPVGFIDYTYTVRNTGDQVLTDLTITDPGVVVSGGPLAMLPISGNDTTTFTGRRILTQADITAGQVTTQATVNTAQGVTDLSDDPAVLPGVDDPTVVRTVGSLIQISKALRSVNSTGPAGVPQVGDTIEYFITVTNNGTNPLTNVMVTDSTGTVIGGPIPVMNPGDVDSATFSVLHTITAQDQIDEEVVNFATVTTDEGVSDDSETIIVPICPPAALVTVGSADADFSGSVDPADVQIGEYVTYKKAGVNNGIEFDLRLTLKANPENIGVAFDLVSGPPIVLSDGDGAPNDAIKCEFKYFITGTDIPLQVPIGFTWGDIDNTNENEGVEIEADSTVSYSTSVNPPTNIETLANRTTSILDGSPGNFVYFTNTGVAGEPVDENLWAQSYHGIRESIDVVFKHRTPSTGYSFSPVAGFGNPGTTIQFNDCRPPTSFPQLAMQKVGIFNGDINAPVVGDTITYLITVSNNGSEALTNISVSDPLLTLPNTMIDLGRNQFDNVTYTTTYSITAANIADGFVENTATASGTAENAGILTTMSTARTFISDAPSLNVTKTGIYNGNANNMAAGDTILYSVEIENNGNLDITDIILQDSLVPLCEDGSSLNFDYNSMVTTGSQTANHQTTIVFANAFSAFQIRTLLGQGYSIIIGDGVSQNAVVDTLDPTDPGGFDATLVASADHTASSNGCANSLAAVDGSNLGGGTSVGNAVRPLVAGDLAAGDKLIRTYTHVVTALEAGNGTITNTLTATGIDTNLASVSGSDTFVLP